MALQALKKRESFSDKAYQMLREAILTGELKPGEQLTEEALSVWQSWRSCKAPLIDSNRQNRNEISHCPAAGDFFLHRKSVSACVVLRYESKTAGWHSLRSHPAVFVIQCI